MTSINNIYSCSNVTGRREIGKNELETEIIDNCINGCSSNVPFKNISSSEEDNFILYKKLTKEPTTHYLIVIETYDLLYEHNATGIKRKIIWVWWYKYQYKWFRSWQIKNSFSWWLGRFFNF